MYPKQPTRGQGSLAFHCSGNKNHMKLQGGQLDFCCVNKNLVEVGVSKNNGTPISSILIGVSIINHPFWGPLFLETSKSFQDFHWFFFVASTKTTKKNTPQIVAPVIRRRIHLHLVRPKIIPQSHQLKVREAQLTEMKLSSAARCAATASQPFMT